MKQWNWLRSLSEKKDLLTLNKFLSGVGERLSNVKTKSLLVHSEDFGVEVEPGCAVIEKELNWSGWGRVYGNAEYVSVDNPTGVITVTGSQTGRISAGTRLKFDNDNDTIYGIVTATPTYSSGTDKTTITFLHETNIANNSARKLMVSGAVTNLRYANAKINPVDFPADPRKWSIRVTHTSFTQRTSPVANTWYNIGNVSMSVPIGLWKLSYKATGFVNRTTAGGLTVVMTLSTANVTAGSGILTTSAASTAQAASSFDFSGSLTASEIVELATKTTYYLNESTPNSGVALLILAANVSTAVVLAECAYL